MRKCNDYKVLQKWKSELFNVPGVNTGPGPVIDLPDAPPELADRKGRVDTPACRRLALIVRMGPTAFTSLVERIETTAASIAASSPDCRSVLIPEEAAAAASSTDRIQDPTGHRPYSPKHALQQTSIVGNMAEFGLFKHAPDTTFIEFGAGKGYLTGMLADCFPTARRLIMMDVRGFKLVADRSLRDRDMLRVRCDIADFEPEGVEGFASKPYWVGHGKHLCGAATDFTLRCAARLFKKEKQMHGVANSANSAGSSQFLGLAVATCCHHRCSWEHIAGQEVFLEWGYTGEEFELISHMTGWALCGHEAPAGGGVVSEEESEDSEHSEPEGEGAMGNCTKNSGTKEEWRPHHSFRRSRRIAIGQKCKRIIDYARGEWLRRNGFEVDDVIYCEPEISGENRMLMAKPLQILKQ